MIGNVRSSRSGFVVYPGARPLMKVGWCIEIRRPLSAAPGTQWRDRSGGLAAGANPAGSSEILWVPGSWEGKVLGCF